MNRDLFLSRVRSSLEKDLHAEASPDAALRAPSPAGSPTSEKDLAERLALEVEAVGGVVHRSRSAEEARESIMRALADNGVRSVVRANTGLLRDLDLDERLGKAGFVVTVCDLRGDVHAERLREAAFAADAGICSADFGLAETGTLVLLARPGQGRAISLIPPLHVAVLRASDIVFESGELFERLGAEGRPLPSAVTFITGPSRTADIELVLTVGVHGPKALHLILLESSP